jgi:serine/threonine protein kinase
VLRLRRSRTLAADTGGRTTGGEWLAGAQLGERLRDGPLPPRDAIRMTARLSDAIQYMHCRRFIYGELRPSNIVFSGRGAAKLVDFESVVRRDRRGRAARLRQGKSKKVKGKRVKGGGWRVEGEGKR